MGQAQINVRTRACSRTFIARTKQAALTRTVMGERDNIFDLDQPLPLTSTVRGRIILFNHGI